MASSRELRLTQELLNHLERSSGILVGSLMAGYRRNANKGRHFLYDTDQHSGDAAYLQHRVWKEAEKAAPFMGALLSEQFDSDGPVPFQPADNADLTVRTGKLSESLDRAGKLALPVAGAILTDYVMYQTIKTQMHWANPLNLVTLPRTTLRIDIEFIRQVEATGCKWCHEEKALFDEADGTYPFRRHRTCHCTMIRE